MKSSYDLLSIFLDNQDLPKPAPMLISLSEVPECAEVGEEYTIFDLLVCKRKISGMRLLSAMSAQEMSSWANASADCKEIIVILDYSSVSQIACTLFLKRVLQGITYLAQNHPEIKIVLAGDLQKWTEPLKLAYTY